MTILTKIIEAKKVEVARLKQSYKLADQLRTTPIYSFIERCEQNQGLHLIAEFKRASPSKGIINAHLDPVEQAQTYQSLGASMVSVLTDQQFFSGRFADLEKVRKSVQLPVLNKDFIIDKIQIDRAYRSGADVILLIVASLDVSRLTELYHYAKGLGLEVLVEVHNERELEQAQTLGARLIGVNNRDLKTFEVDLAVTERLAQLINHDREILISESGIQSKADIARVKQAGARAVLIGETLMRATNLQETLKNIFI